MLTPPDRDPIVLDLVAHTDFSGKIRRRTNYPGSAMLAAAFEHFRADNPDGTLILDAGDIGIAKAMYGTTDELPVVDILNLLGYTALTLGNHELDRGPDYARERLAVAAFPVLCANVVFKDSGELLDFVQPYVVTERHGVRVGIIGVTTEYTPFMMLPGAFEDLTMLDPATVCAELVPHLRSVEKVDVVVVLGHLPGRIHDDGTREGEIFEVASAVRALGADVVFGGHNPGDIAVTHDDVTVNKPGDFYGRAVGHVRLAIDPITRQVATLVNEIVQLEPDERGLHLVPDPVVEAAVSEAIAPFAPLLDEQLGIAEDRIETPYRGEAALGSFLTDCLRAAFHADVAIMNSTSLGGTIEPGAITVEVLIASMPFDDPLHVGEMTGAQLWGVFELTYDDDHRAVNGDMQVSGLTVVVDTRRPPGTRVVSIALPDGSELDASRRYRVATSAYIAGGGNGYGELLTATEWERTDRSAHALFVEMTRGARLTAGLSGRITDLAEHTDHATGTASPPTAEPVEEPIDEPVEEPIEIEEPIEEVSR